MLDPNRLLLNEILKRNFNYIITIIKANGEEKELIIKAKKKDFLKQLGDLKIRVVLIDRYPNRDNWEIGVFYLVRSGETLYYKEKEEKSFEL